MRKHCLKNRKFITCAYSRSCRYVHVSGILARRSNLAATILGVAATVLVESVYVSLLSGKLWYFFLVVKKPRSISVSVAAVQEVVAVHYVALLA